SSVEEIAQTESHGEAHGVEVSDFASTYRNIRIRGKDYLHLGVGRLLLHDKVIGPAGHVHAGHGVYVALEATGTGKVAEHDVQPPPGVWGQVRQRIVEAVLAPREMLVVSKLPNLNPPIS